MIGGSFWCVELNVVTLVAVYVRGSLLVWDIIRTKPLMTIDARESSTPVHGILKDARIHI